MLVSVTCGGVRDRRHIDVERQCFEAELASVVRLLFLLCHRNGSFEAAGGENLSTIPASGNVKDGCQKCMIKI